MNRTFFFVVMALQTLWSFSQTRHFYTSERLSSNQITQICQDRVGYVWVGTDYGLNKYDGYRFTTYLHESGNTGSVSSNVVSFLFTDGQGRLWVGTQKGLDRYDDANDRFEHIALRGAKEVPRINYILQEDAGHLLVGTAGYGLFRLDLRNDSTQKLEGYARGDNNFFSYIFIDDEGSFWKSGHGSSIVRRSPEGLVQEFVSPYGTVTGFVGYEGGVVMICVHGMLFYRDGVMHSDYFDPGDLGGKEMLLRTAMKDHRGNLFIGTMGDGLFWIPKGGHRLMRYEYQSASIDLNTATVWALFEDNQENLWVGCQKRGLLLLPQRKPQFRSWKFGDQHINTGGSLTSVCMGDNGIVWCSVQNNGIYGMDAEGRVVAHPASPQGTFIIYRETGAQGREGTGGGYWIGTNSGLYAYNPLTGEYHQRVAFGNGYINTMVDDGQGNLYFSVFSEGFYRYNTHSGELRQFSMHDTDERRGRLHNDWISQLYLDSRGKLWICTASGVNCYDPAEDHFHPYGWEVILDYNAVESVCETKDRRILLGTNTGLYLYEKGKQDAVPYPEAEVLANKVVGGIVEDQSGDLWLSTTMGIWQVARGKGQGAGSEGQGTSQGDFVGHIHGNGLISREYVSGVVMHGADDRIWFGFSDGITSFYPHSLRNYRPPQKSVCLTGLFIGGSAVNTSTLSDGVPVIDGPLAESSRFQFSYLDNSFTMEFSLLNYSNAENIIFEYRLCSASPIGLSKNGAKEWTRTVAGNNVVAFNHLQPGFYIIEVRALDNGVYTETQVYRIIVRTPWYRSAWAYLIYIIISMSVAGLLLWLYIRRRREELDEEKMKFLINATHDIRSPLTLVMSPLHKLLKRDLDNDVKEELKTIEHNANRIQNLVNQILDIRKIDKQQMKLKCQETEIVQYLGNILKTYEYTALERDIKFVYTPAVEKLNVWLDRNGLDKVVDNLLSNAFKYTYDGGEIEVRVDKETGRQEEAVLQVIDNGMGIKGDVHKIFDRFYQGSTSRSLHIEGTGIGLNLCKMIVSMHHGTIEASNRQDTQGSIFTVRLPLGSAHFTKEELKMEDGRREMEDGRGKRKVQSNHHILVVDDDAEIGSYISQELGSYYHITAVTSAREALRLLLNVQPPIANRQYDLVISDVMMPEMDGFTFLRLVKTNMNISHIPVVMLTSKADVANRLEGLEKGADAYLAKPFDMDELHVVINNLINKTLRLRGKYTGTQQQKDKVEEKQVKGNDELLMERIMKVVNAHLSDSDFNVETITAEVGISRAQLHRKMKEMTGLPISEFIRNIRLEQAVRLLKEQKINVTQVAYTVGFSNLGHFSTVFRKQFGVSPTEFMERNGGSETKTE